MRITKLQQAEINISFELIKQIEPSIMFAQDKNIIQISGDGFSSKCVVLNKGFFDFRALVKCIARATGKLSFMIKAQQSAALTKNNLIEVVK